MQKIEVRSCQGGCSSSSSTRCTSSRSHDTKLSALFWCDSRLPPLRLSLCNSAAVRSLPSQMDRRCRLVFFSFFFLTDPIPIQDRAPTLFQIDTRLSYTVCIIFLHSVMHTRIAEFLEWNWSEWPEAEKRSLARWTSAPAPGEAINDMVVSSFLLGFTVSVGPSVRPSGGLSDCPSVCLGSTLPRVTHRVTLNYRLKISLVIRLKPHWYPLRLFS